MLISAINLTPPNAANLLKSADKKEERYWIAEIERRLASGVAP